MEGVSPTSFGLWLRYLNWWRFPSSSRRSSAWWDSSTQIPSSSTRYSSARESSPGEPSPREPSCRYVILGQLNWWQFWESLWSSTWWVSSVRSGSTSKCCLVIYYISHSSDSVTSVWVDVFHYFPSEVMDFIVDPLFSCFAFSHCSHGGWIDVNRLS